MAERTKKRNRFMPRWWNKAWSGAASGVLVVLVSISTLVLNGFGLLDRLVGGPRLEESTPKTPLRDNADPDRCPMPVTELDRFSVPKDVTGIEDQKLRLRISPPEMCDAVWALAEQPDETPCDASGGHCVDIWIVRRSKDRATDKQSIIRHHAPTAYSVYSYALNNDDGAFKACVSPKNAPKRTFCTPWQSTKL